jgi:protein-ribulosamine 3-kinase
MMWAQVPEVLEIAVSDELRRRLGSTISTKRFTPSGGGCINNGGKLETTGGDFFLKWNDRLRFPGMFEAEAKGLSVLQQSKAITIPTVELVGEAGEIQYLLLGFIASAAKRNDYWAQLGEGLAYLHKATARAFGLDHHNYIGSLPQSNVSNASWIRFFIEQRLEPQLVLAEDHKLIDPSLRKYFDNLYAKLPSLLSTERPSLLHGDLWRGNVMTDETGAPVLIDPAIYFGHREVDLAMTTLFGGFSDLFFDSYKSAFPLEGGFEERLEIYNLYPLLVHVNLFGAGYLSQVRSIVQRYR